MKFFSGFGKVKDKLSAQRFTFSITVHNLQPWPHGNRAVAVGWQRGKQKRGATRSVYASTAPGRIGSVVRFNEKFDLSASLYKAANGTPNVSQLGPFKKKCLILAVLETDGKTQATAALGRVVIDLAEFAAVDNTETRAFMVSCNRQIHAAVGEPQLLITIRTQWKKSSATGGQGGMEAGEDGGSMSTDTTGSRMTANLSSFLRFKYTGKGAAAPNEEQDLGGFDNSGQRGREAGSLANQAAAMGTIQEGQDEPSESPHNGGGGMQPAGMYDQGPRQPGSAAANIAGSSLRARHAANLGTGPGIQSIGVQGIQGIGGAPPRHQSISSHPATTYDRYSQDNKADRFAGPQAPGLYPAAAPVSGMYSGGGQQPQQPQPRHSEGHWGPASGPGPQQYDGPRSRTYSGDTNGGAAGGLPAPHMPGLSPGSAYGGGEDGSLQHQPSGVSTPMPEMQRSQALFAGLSLQSAGGLSFDGMQQELVSTAALEVTVHLARACASGSKRPERAAHAAARRLARTLVCLGQQQAPVFGSHVLRLVNSIVEGSRGELGALAFWWSNMAHLRGLLQGGAPTRAPPSTLAEPLLPQVLAVERLSFELLLSNLWHDVLLPTVTNDRGLGMTSGGGALPSSPVGSAALKASSSIAGRRAQQESAMKKWFEGLDKVKNVLLGLQPVNRPAAFGEVTTVDGHMATLRAQLLQQCLRRVDALLFFNLLAPGDNAATQLLADYDPTVSLWGAPGTPAPTLQDAHLPFTRGALAFGSGMSIKMIVTRLQQWADSGGPASVGASMLTRLPSMSASAGGSGVLQAGGVGALGPMLFPLLRASADLLMMPKEMLLEPSIRRDCSQALSSRSMLHILEHFQPDEYAAEPIAPAILLTLREEAMVGQSAGGGPGPGRPPLTHLAASYRPPPEEQLMAQVQSGAEPGLAYDADSEDELASLASHAALPGSAARFKLLHDLWVSRSLRSAASASSSTHTSPGPAALQYGY